MTNFSLSQAAVATSNPMSIGVRNLIEEENPIVRAINWFSTPKGQSNFRWHEETALPSAAFRAINAGYTAGFGSLIPKNEPMAILGGEFITDRALPNLYGNELPDMVVRQYAMLARAAARKFEETYFEGDTGVDPNAFDGLRVRCAERGMEFDATGSGTDRVELTLAMLDEVHDAVLGSKVWYLNQWEKRKINALVRAAGQAREQVSPEFGGQFDAYAGVPLIVQERRNDMSTILGFDEDPGDGGDDSGSMYCVHNGTPDEDNAIVGIVGYGGAWDVYGLGEDWENPQEKGRLEVYVGMANIGNRGAARLKGIGQL